MPKIYFLTLWEEVWPEVQNQVSIGLRSLLRPPERILPCLFQLLVVACTPSHFLACSCIILISSSVVMGHSPCMCVCPNPPLLSFRRTPFTGLRQARKTSFKFDYICKISFPNKITPFYHHTNRDTRNHETDPQVPCRREFRGFRDPKQYSTMSHDLSIKQQHYLLFLCRLSFDQSVCLSAQHSPSASLHAPYIVTSLLAGGTLNLRWKDPHTYILFLSYRHIL